MAVISAGNLNPADARVERHAVGGWRHAERPPFLADLRGGREPARAHLLLVVVVDAQTEHAVVSVRAFNMMKVIGGHEELAAKER